MLPLIEENTTLRDRLQIEVSGDNSPLLRIIQTESVGDTSSRCLSLADTLRAIQRHSG